MLGLLTPSGGGDSWDSSAGTEYGVRSMEYGVWSDAYERCVMPMAMQLLARYGVLTVVLRTD